MFFRSFRHNTPIAREGIFRYTIATPSYVLFRKRSGANWIRPDGMRRWLRAEVPGGLVKPGTTDSCQTATSYGCLIDSPSPVIWARGLQVDESNGLAGEEWLGYPAGTAVKLVAKAACRFAAARRETMKRIRM